MATPALAALASLLTATRYFTQFDSYHYTVDNRPLADISANVSTLATYAESLARASLLSEVASTEMYRHVCGTRGGIHGMGVTSDLGISGGNRLIQIGGGVLYSLQPFDTVNTIDVIKPALSLEGYTALAPIPATAGNSINSIVYLEYVPLSASTTLPGVVGTMAAGIQSMTLTGEAKFSIVSGAPNVTGSQVDPTIPAGVYPLYRIVTTSSGGTSTYTVVDHDMVPINLSDSVFTA